MVITQAPVLMDGSNAGCEGRMLGWLGVRIGVSIGCRGSRALLIRGRWLQCEQRDGAPVECL